MKHFIYAIFLFAFGVEAQQNLRTSDAQQHTSARVEQNYVKNSGAEKGLHDIENTDGIVTRETSGTILLGKASFGIDADASGETACWSLNPLQAEMNGNAVGAFEYTGDASLYKAYVYNVTDSRNASAEYQLTNSSNTAGVELVFVADSSKEYKLCIEATDNAAAAFRADKFNVSVWDGGSEYQDVEVVFNAARSANQSIATETATIVLWDTVTHNSGGVFSSGVLTVDKFGDYQICATARLADASGWSAGEIFSLRAVHESNEKYLARYSYDTSSSSSPTLSGCATFTDVEVGDDLFVRVAQNNGSSINLIDNAAFNTISILYISPKKTAVEINAPGTDWTSYTPTITYGSGGMTNATTVAEYLCNGPTLAVRGVTTFSGNSDSYSSPRYSLPAGAVPNFQSSRSIRGGFTLGAGAANRVGPVFVGSSDSLIYPVLYNQSSPSSDNYVDTTPITNSLVGSSGHVIEFYIPNIPIQAGFCPSTPMPRITQSVIYDTEVIAQGMGGTTSAEEIDSTFTQTGVTNVSSVDGNARCAIIRVGKVFSGSCTIRYAAASSGSVSTVDVTLPWTIASASGTASRASPSEVGWVTASSGKLRFDINSGNTGTGSRLASFAGKIQ